MATQLASRFQPDTEHRHAHVTHPGGRIFRIVVTKFAPINKVPMPELCKYLIDSNPNSFRLWTRHKTAIEAKSTRIEQIGERVFDYLTQSRAGGPKSQQTSESLSLSLPETQNLANGLVRIG
jgi:hypothetical protein